MCSNLEFTFQLFFLGGGGVLFTDDFEYQCCIMVDGMMLDE
jgi:hypothetical protein